MNRNLLLTLVAGAVMAAGCAVPRYIWPQKDIASRRVNPGRGDRTVLIASRSTEYKEALVRKLAEGFRGAGVNLDVIGLDSLVTRDAAAYEAVVLINTCMAWGMDRKVTAFLDRYGDHRNFIVYTTGGDENWLPKMNGRNFDAVSGASVMNQVDAKAFEIASKINTLLNSSDTP